MQRQRVCNQMLDATHPFLHFRALRLRQFIERQRFRVVVDDPSSIPVCRFRLRLGEAFVLIPHFSP